MPMKRNRPDVSSVFGGLAGKAARSLKGRKSRIDSALRKVSTKKKKKGY